MAEKGPTRTSAYGHRITRPLKSPRKRPEHHSAMERRGHVRAGGESGHVVGSLRAKATCSQEGPECAGRGDDRSSHLGACRARIPITFVSANQGGQILQVPTTTWNLTLKTNRLRSGEAGGRAEKQQGQFERGLGRTGERVPH